MTTTIHTKSELDTITLGFGIAAVITIVFNTLLTILKESYPPLLAFMKSISILGVKHHWLVHGLTIVILFYLLGWFFSKRKSLSSISDRALAKAIIVATVLGALGIIIFYLIELFK